MEQWWLTLKNFHLRFSQHNSTTLVYNTPHLSPLIEMSDVLEPLKTAVLDHSKCVPDMHMGEKGDFEAWGKQFMVLLVSFDVFCDA